MSLRTNIKKLYTLGYEGQNIDVFISELKKNRIDTLVDIRELPLSRKKGFSKKALVNKLEEENIRYVHFKNLGSPSEIRKKVREDKNYKSFFSKFSEYLSNQGECLKAVLELTEFQNCCLLCFEKDPEICHRMIVAKEILNMDRKGLTIEHL